MSLTGTYSSGGVATALNAFELQGTDSTGFAAFVDGGGKAVATMAPNKLALRDSAGLDFLDSSSFAAWSGTGTAFVFGSTFTLAMKEDAGATVVDCSSFLGQHTAGTGIVEQVASAVVHVSKSSSGAVVASPGNRLRNGDAVLMDFVDGFDPELSATPHPLNSKIFTVDVPTAGTVAVTACAKSDPALVTVTPGHSLQHGDDVVFDSIGGQVELNWDTNGNKGYTVDTGLRITGVTSSNPAVVTVEDLSGLANGDVVQLSGVGGMPLASGLFRASQLNVHSVAVAAISNALPAVVSAPGHGRTDGDSVTLSDVVGMTEVNGNTYKVANAQATQATVTSITSGTTTVVTTTAPHGLSNGDKVKVDGVVGLAQPASPPSQPYLNGGIYTVSSASTSAFTLRNVMGTSNINTLGYSKYLGGGVVTWSTFALKVSCRL